MTTTVIQPGHPLTAQHLAADTKIEVGTGGSRLAVDRDAQLQRAARQAGQLRRGFYLVVLLVALAGQVSGAQESLHLRPLVAIPAVAALELGGMVVLTNADIRRQLGERAIGSRILSAAIAAGAVWFNASAHHDHLVGGFFAGMSALGYLVWLTHSENTRRDRLRAVGDLPPTTPAYELVGHWLRHPALTQRARSLAKANPALDLYGSITAAHQQRQRERRREAITAILQRKIHAAVDQDTAALAVAIYNLDEIAQQLSARADHTTLTDLIAADLQPDRLTSGRTSKTQMTSGKESAPATSLADSMAEPSRSAVTAIEAAHRPVGDSSSEVTTTPDRTTRTRLVQAPVTSRATPTQPSTNALLATVDGPGPVATVRAAEPDVSSGEGDGPGTTDNSAKSLHNVPPNTAAAVAYWHRQDPSLHPAQIGNRIGRSERTVRRYWPPRLDPEPGAAHYPAPSAVPESDHTHVRPRR
jgi:hypothetical protein